MCDLDAVRKDGYLARMAENLPMLRAKLGLTQEALCGLVGVSRQTVVQAERNRKLSWNTYLSLVLVFGMNPDTRELMEFLRIYPAEFARELSCHRSQASREREVI